MEDKTRLGRGLEEVSQFYLTGGPRDDPERQITPIKAHRAKAPIKVFHPGSCRMQSFFLTNFALELARNRVPAFVWDCLDRHEEGICAHMRSLIRTDKDTGKATASLYGLPDIVIYSESCQSSETLAGLVTKIHSLEDGGCLLVNTPEPLRAVLNDDLNADCILMTRANEKALLACYAYVKVILESGSPGDISLIFDDPGGEEEADALLRRFARFIENKLSFSLRYLGALHHDEYLDQSIEESRPLMLFREPSETKEDLASICSSYLHRRQSEQGG